MRILSDAAKAAILAGDAVVGGSVEIMCDPPLRVFSGDGRVEIDGEVYAGIAHGTLVSQTGGALGASASASTLSLSGVDPDTLALLDADEAKGAAVVQRRLIANSSGTELLDAPVFLRGRIDKVETQETLGGEATVIGMIEGVARGLGRRSGRLRTDADQRLIDPDDGGHKRISYAGEKQLYWGGKPPANAGSSLSAPPSGSRNGGGGGGGGFEHAVHQ